MTAQTENTDFDTNFIDLLRKKFGEEKKAHEETILQLLSAQAQAQTAEAEAAKAQKLVAETTLKLDQAREEIKGLRAQAQDAQVQAQEAQAKIKDLGIQMDQTAMLAEELKEAKKTIVRLEARMANARFVLNNDSKVDPIEPEAQESLSQLLLASQTQIKDLKSEMAQTAIETQEEIWFLRGQAQALRTQVEELRESHAKAQKSRAEELGFAQVIIMDLKSQLGQAQSKVAQAEEEVGRLRAQTEAFGAQAQELQVTQAKIKDLEAQMAQAAFETKSQAQELEGAQAQVKDLESKVAEAQEEVGRLRAQSGAQAQELQQSQAKIKNLEAQMVQAAIETQSQAQKLQEAQAKIKVLEAQVPKPPALAPVKMAEQYSPIRKSSSQWFCIVQNGRRLYFEKMSNCHAFTKFIAKKDATLELAGPEITLTSCFRVIVCDGQDWETIGHIDPENKKILIGRLIWKWVTKCTPARINADGKEEYQLQILIY